MLHYKLHAAHWTLQNTQGQKLFLPENSKILIFTITVKLEDKKKPKKARIG